MGKLVGPGTPIESRQLTGMCRWTLLGGAYGHAVARIGHKCVCNIVMEAHRVMADWTGRCANDSARTQRFDVGCIIDSGFYTGNCGHFHPSFSLSGNIRDHDLKPIYRHPSLIAKDTSLTLLQDPGVMRW